MGIVSYSLVEALLYLEAGVVGVVEYAELAVAALAVQVVVAFLVFIEVYAPVHELAYLPGRAFHYFFYGLGVAEPVAGDHGVVDVFVEIVDFEISHRGHAALGKGCICLVESRFADQCDTRPLAGNLQCETHAGNA